MIATRLLRELTLPTPAQPGRGPHLAAASGAVRLEDWLYVISDDERALARFPLAGGHGAWWPLPGASLPLEAKARKAKKPDYEALVHAGRWSDALIAFPSGSAPERFVAAVIPVATPTSVTGVDLRALYGALASEVPRLNIEGAALVGETLLLLHRGNAAGGFSALFTLPAESVLGAMVAGKAPAAPRTLDPLRLSLPKLAGVPLTPTDVVPLDEGRLLFSAVAEATDDPYLDGACVGAALVVLHPDLRLETFELDRPWKIEGVALARDGSVLMVTDADDPAKPAALLAARLPPLSR